MSECLTEQVNNYAIYLPAISRAYSEYVSEQDEDAPRGLQPGDLDFLKGKNDLWSYKWCLASAGTFAYTQSPNSITRRNSETSMVIGDSGGYQVATGALRGMKGWVRHQDRIGELWTQSQIRADMLRWLDLHCDYAMTLDIPLWLKSEQFAHTPFYNCSVEELTNLTVENVHYFDKHRGVVGECKFLNVIQGRSEEEEDYWYSRVRDFQFEGWALGGSSGRNFDIVRVLRRVLLLRDHGMLGAGRNWLHILGLSKLVWAVALTAIQRGIQKHCGVPFVVSFDSATPFLWAGKYQTYALPPKLTADFDTWKMSSRPFPVGFAAVTSRASEPFPEGSPLSTRLTLGDVNTKTSPYAAQTLSNFALHALSNHNLYVFLRAIINANHTVFSGKEAPEQILAMTGAISKLFACEGWADRLRDMTPILRKALPGKELTSHWYA
jgi:hypothetical protein